MRARSWGAAGLAALALVWGGAGYLATAPTDGHDYRVAAVGSARSAYNALASAGLTAHALRRGRVTQPYADSVFADARDALAGAAKRFADVSPPDAPSRRMHDELAPLLSGADAALGEIAEYRPDAGDRIASRLDDFMDEHR